MREKAHTREGSYAESRPYADFLGYVTPWYSAGRVTDGDAARPQESRHH